MKGIITLGEFYSWEVISDREIIKTMDKSVFKSNQSGVPNEIRSFFEVENLKIGEKKELTIYFKQGIFDADIKIHKKENSKIGQAKINWKNALAEHLELAFPNALEKLDKCEYTKEFAPKMKFIKMGSTTYKLELIEAESFFIEPKDELSLPKPKLEGLEEGEKSYRVNKYFERNPKNRQAAIKYHGTTCSICGFNFEKVYGELGKDYIEIHHTTPLYTLDKVVKINPITDLVPVCANCHRMIHRDRKEFKSIDEVKQEIEKYKMKDILV